METHRVRSVLVALAVAAFLSVSVHGAVPDYKLGEIAREDVITPVALVVVNPEATEALKQKVAQQVNPVVRHARPIGAEVEAELRASVATARKIFVETVQGAAPDSPVFAGIIRQLARQSPKDLPFDTLAPLWARGVDDEAFVEALLKPVREAMAQPIMANKNDPAVATNLPVRLVPVKKADEIPGTREIESMGATVSSGKIVTLWRAKRLVETHFPAGQEAVGRFAASFVRVNAFLDLPLTDLWRAQRIEGLAVNDTYEAAQVIVSKGQPIDRKALGALAAMREKSLIGTLQNKLEQQQSVAGQIRQQTSWIVGGLGLVGVALIVIFWRLRARPASTALVLAGDPALVGGAQQALPGGDDRAWRERALVAEGKAERAQEAIRTGVLGWMRDRVFHTISNQRAELLSVQRKAEAEMRELEQRLERLHTPLKERVTAYEKRIEELEKDLAVKGEQNRELIQARISVARQQLTVERERGRFGTN